MNFAEVPNSVHARLVGEVEEHVAAGWNGEPS